MVIDTIIISVLVTVLVFLNGFIFYQYRKHKNLLSKYVELTMDNISLSDALNKINDNLGNASVNDPDGFIKFLSQSREWAFGYIEEVQSAITDLSVAMEAKDDDKIKDSYIKLMTYLPQQEANN